MVRGSGYSSEGVVPIAGYARYTAKLCQTPCRLRLDPGFYHLQLGDGLTSPTLDFTTTGRDYAYSVKPERVGLVIGGIVVSSVGFGTAFSGVILGVVGYAVGDDGLRTTGVGVAIGGTALGLLGIPMFRAGRSSYREIPVDTAWAQFEG